MGHFCLGFLFLSLSQWASWCFQFRLSERMPADPLLLRFPPSLAAPWSCPLMTPFPFPSHASVLAVSSLLCLHSLPWQSYPDPEQKYHLFAKMFISPQSVLPESRLEHWTLIHTCVTDISNFTILKLSTNSLPAKPVTLKDFCLSQLGAALLLWPKACRNDQLPLFLSYPTSHPLENPIDYIFKIDLFLRPPPSPPQWKPPSFLAQIIRQPLAGLAALPLCSQFGSKSDPDIQEEIQMMPPFSKPCSGYPVSQIP